jgi:hypothetical protein
VIQFDRPRRGFQDDIEVDIKGLGYEGMIGTRRSSSEHGQKLSVFINAGNFFTA